MELTTKRGYDVIFGGLEIVEYYITGGREKVSVIVEAARQTLLKEDLLPTGEFKVTWGGDEPFYFKACKYDKRHSKLLQFNIIGAFVDKLTKELTRGKEEFYSS